MRCACWLAGWLQARKEEGLVSIEMVVRAATEMSQTPVLRMVEKGLRDGQALLLVALLQQVGQSVWPVTGYRGSGG
jgi:hypothetical protein